MSEPKKIEGLFESISGSVGKLDELERTYNEARGNLVAELVFHLDQLAAAADSQATRASVVRELYWNSKIPSELIGTSFKLKKHTLRKVAGAHVLTLPCPNGCGNSVKREFKSRLQLKNYGGENRSSRRRGYLSPYACDECKRRSEAVKEAEAARKRRRNAELRDMAWAEFAETGEWTEIRNEQMHFAGYSCQRCHVNGVGLYVYLGRDTPQDYPLSYSSEYQYFVLCGNCAPLCDELINPDKGEYIKSEFIWSIKDWNQGNHYDISYQ